MLVVLDHTRKQAPPGVPENYMAGCGRAYTASAIPSIRRLSVCSSSTPICRCQVLGPDVASNRTEIR